MSRLSKSAWGALASALLGAGCLGPPSAASYRSSVFRTATRRLGQDHSEEVRGTAFVVDESGLLLTCGHNLPRGSWGAVRILAPWGALPAEVLEVHPNLDLALLRVPADPRLGALALAGSDPRENEPIRILGFPLGKGSVERIRMHRGRVVHGSPQALVSVRGRARWYRDLLATDVEVTEGWSGGPMVNEDGEVVGILVLAAGLPRRPGEGFGLKVSAIAAVVSAWLHHPVSG